MTSHPIDDRTLEVLIEESNDLQLDALRDMNSALPDLAEVREQRREDVRKGNVDLEARKTVNDEVAMQRRQVLRDAGWSLGSIGRKGLFATSLGGLLAAVVGSPVAADTELDVDMLQTAAALENLAVGTYKVALTLPFIKDGNKTVKAFAETTMKQHDEHSQAFNAQVSTLGGKEQKEAHPGFAKAVEEAKPTLTDPLKVAQLAAVLEKVATDTYLTNLTKLEDQESKKIFARIMGVESQHLATLRAVEALLKGGAEELVAVPTNLAKLPAAAGSVAFPDALHEFDPSKENQAGGIATPESGAVK